MASYTHPDTKKTYKSDPLIYQYSNPALPIGYLRAKEIYCPPQYVMNNNTFYFVLMPKLDNNDDPTIESLAISYGEYINGKFESNWAKKGGTSWTAEEPNIAAGKPGVNRAAIYNPIKNIQIGITKTSSTPQDVMELEGYSLKGATFEIWTAKEGGTKVTMYKDEANKQPVTQLVTDDKGKTPIYYIPVKSNATYWVREVVAPPGHKIHEPQSFTVTLPADAGKTKDVKFEDDPEWTKVPDAAVRKLNNSGRPIPGVVFKVCMYDGKYDTPSACPASKLKKTWYLESDEKGKVIFDEASVPDDFANQCDTFYTDSNGKIVIPVNATLTMQEVKAPADCILDDTVMLWDTSGKVVEMKTHYNDKKPSSITIKKKDDDGQSPLSGVKFMLEFIKAKSTPTADANPNPSYTPLLKEGESVTATTDSAGTIKWENLDEGEYRITEIETVPGHTLLPEPIEITLPLVMTEQEVQQGNVDTSKGTFDDGYSNNWFFNDLTYEVTNSSTLDMPMTGAGGFWKYGFIGIGTMAAMVGGVVVYDMQKKRKRNKRCKK